MQDSYIFTTQAIAMGHRDILEQMCEQAQNDSFQNQELQNTLQELMENLDQTITQDTQEPEGDTEQIDQETEWWTTSTQPIYIPLTQEEQEILEQINKNNHRRLENMMQIRSNNYDPKETLNQLFDIFYPDDSQFNIPWR